MVPKFFANSGKWRVWLERHHESRTELLVGFYKRHSDKAGMTWSESVDQALCFGWIDGVRRRIDDDTYSIRFTPRKPRSIWSAVNIRKVEVLSRAGLMTPAGLKGFEAREEKRSRVYAFEQDHIEFDADQKAQFEADVEAWAFFAAQPLYYQRVATWRVISAKRPDTRMRRLCNLIELSANGRRLDGF